ncbi:polycomb protein SCMH1-like protein [Aphelenchoides avenae]|nr:polycomb protein SCMH1-like protein [Aphelenchus avenae]
MVHDVYRWAFAVTESLKAAERFIEHDIDGAALLLLTRTTMLKEMGLKLGPAVKLYKALEKLKATRSSD